MAQNAAIFLQNNFIRCQMVTLSHLRYKNIITAGYFQLLYHQKQGVPIVGVPRGFLYSESPHSGYATHTNAIRTPTILTQLILQLPVKLVNLFFEVNLVTVLYFQYYFSIENFSYEIWYGQFSFSPAACQSHQQLVITPWYQQIFVQLNYFRSKMYSQSREQFYCHNSYLQQYLNI